MKAFTNHQPGREFVPRKSSTFSASAQDSITKVSDRSVNLFNPDALNSITASGLTHNKLLTTRALYQMALGHIPDLLEVCLELHNTFFQKGATNTAIQFIPVLKKLISINQMEVERFLKNPVTNHVLIQNELLKVVLIHWPSGKTSGIHGHPKGGCVFKVLQGRIEEMRYSAESSPRLLSVSTYQKGGIGYIDDQMAYHAVGNPFNTSAISLHVYSPGLK